MQNLELQCLGTECYFRELVSPLIWPLSPGFLNKYDVTITQNKFCGKELPSLFYCGIRCSGQIFWQVSRNWKVPGLDCHVNIHRVAPGSLLKTSCHFWHGSPYPEAPTTFDL